MKIYIHEQDGWANFTWSDKPVLLKLGEARNLQGRLLGRMESLGFELRNEAVLNTLTLDVLKSSEIEGEYLEKAQVRS
ncbi:MAG: DUF4172 domain-containing protein, partial [Bacteroidales bacterium]|nr:DUF4172 domain-containing protein [Bacteroidales bacterium]